ncbi:hypothetical protein KUH32_01260 [Thalassococcus sp. CAU 1522]|uniref:Uncharacterized protein n=1 Tax=Thalassococcus arenae TaxID=2851652 RepID=A0ABS6N2Y4_9RHOB|nr:hypothetical protein [Thalassococcus arenae]MBV2358390.1 hypothetical protein [Thalassococcus arenae]
MSPPDTNLEVQKRRHKPALWGIVAVVIFAAILLFGLLVVLAERGNAPQGADTQIEFPVLPTPPSD